MRHLDVAQLYLKLCHASDTNYLLREAIGQLSTFLIRHERSLTSKHVRSVVLCKAIFDSQRIYLSTRDPDPRKILDLDCLLDAITCLVSVRNEINKPQNRDVNQDGQSLLRQAFVSGLRALLLRHSVRQRTLDSLAEWTRNWDAYDDIDTKIVRPLLDEANQPGRNGRRVAGLTLAEADTRGPAMFFLHNWSSLKPKLIYCLNDYRSSDAQAFWLCYDARLALFNASYHFLQHNDNSETINHSKDTVDRPDMLTLVQQCARDFEEIMSQSSQGRPRSFIAQMLEQLEPTPHCHNCKTICSCFAPANDHDLGGCDQRLLQDSIIALNEYLSTRALATFNGSHELVNLAKTSEKWNDDWLVKQSTSLEHRYEMHGLETSQEPSIYRKASYVLNCRGMHCVSGETLLYWMHDMRRAVGVDKLLTGESLFEVNIDCKSCLTEGALHASASLARKVTPLLQISNDFAEIQRKWEVWQPEHELDTPPDTAVVQSPVSPSTQVQPSRNNSSESGSHRRRGSSSEALDIQEATSSSNHSSGFLKIFKKDASASSRIATDLSEIEFHSLITADGHYAIVWYKSKMAIFVRHKQHWMTPLSLDGDINFLCASGRVLCITVKTAEGCKLLTYSLPDGKKLPQEVHIPDNVHCMALSMDSKALIIGTSQSTYRILFATSQKTIVGFLVQRRPITPPKDCPTNTTVDSQAVSFSPNGHRAVLATRFKPSGQIKCIIYDTVEREEFVSKGAIKLHDPLKLIGARDFGLTAVPCHYDQDTQITTFLVCCSADNGKQMLYSFDEVSRKPKQMDIIFSSRTGDPGPSIHKAISLPGTHSFVLLNELGHMWVLQRPDAPGNWTSKRHILNKAPQKSSQNRRPRTYLSGKESSEVQICCVEKGKAKLFLCQMGVQTDTKVEEIDLYPFLSTQ